jgi:hypothetical protein
VITVQQDLTATFTDAAETGAPGCTRTVIRTWSATDGCGNTGTTNSNNNIYKRYASTNI